MAKLSIIRFDLNSPDSYDVNRLPEGIKGDPGLMMWKELCRSGIYETNGVKHNIDRAFLENIVKIFWERNAKGIEVPCPVGHTHDPEAKRGKVVYVELREGKNGVVSLYGIIEFVNEEAKEKLSNSGVSIEAPEIVTDGDGETHKYGLEHVAFTDYPVVAGMEGFRDVTFSIYTKKEKKMGKKKRRFSEEERDEEMDKCPNCGHEFDDEEQDVQQSRKRCGRRFADEDDQEEVKASKRYGRRFGDDEEFDDDEEENISQSRKRCGRKFANDVVYDFEDYENVDEDSDEDEEDEADETTVQQSKKRYGRRFADDDEGDVKQSRRYSRRFGKRFSLGRSQTTARILQENRNFQIDRLLRDGYITPAQAGFLEDKFCNERAISFALDAPNDKSFDRMVEFAQMGIGADYSERTGIQFSNHEPKDALDRIFEQRHGGNK